LIRSLPLVSPSGYWPRQYLAHGSQPWECHAAGSPNWLGWLIREDRQTNGTSAVPFPIHADGIQSFLTVSLFNDHWDHHPGEAPKPVDGRLSQNPG